MKEERKIYLETVRKKQGEEEKLIDLIKNVALETTAEDFGMFQICFFIVIIEF